MRAPDETAGNERLYVLIASVVLLLVSAGGMFLVVVSMRELEMLFGSRGAPSLAFSLQFIGSGIGGIVMGYILDRRGYGPPALIGALMIGFGAMLASQVNAAWQLHVIYLIMFGLAGQGSLAAPAMANIAKWYTRRRGMAVGIVAGGQSLAGIVWPPVFANVLTVTDWRTMFFWFGAFCLAVMLPLCLVVKRRPPPPESAPALARASARATPGGPPRRVRPPLSPNATTATLSIAIVGCCVAMALPLGHMVSYVRDLGHPLSSAANVLAVSLMAAFVSRALFVGLLSDRVGGLRALFVFSVIQGAMLAAIVSVSDLWALYLFGALYGLGYGGIFPVYSVAVREHLPIGEIGWRTGFIFLFGAVAMGFGGWMGGALFDLTGSYTPPFLIGVAFNVANLIVVAFLILRLRPGSMRTAVAS